MNPLLPKNYQRDLRLRYSKFFGELLLGYISRFIFFSNSFDLNRGELSPSVFNSNWSRRSSFFSSVRNIIAICSQKKMFRIYASPVVTMVAYTQTLWDSSEINFIGRAMGLSAFCIKAKNSISLYFSRSKPFPTFFCLFNFFKETSFKVHEMSVR